MAGITSGLKERCIGAAMCFIQMTVLSFAENLKIGVMTSQSRSQRFMAFGYFSDHFSVIRSRSARQRR